MRIHIPSLPHTETTRAYSWCAYTEKVRKFVDMMTSLGHEVFLYAGEENEANATEHVVCITQPEQAFLFEGIPPFDAHHPGWMLFADRAKAAIRERLRPGDYIGIIGGHAQAPIAAAFPDNRVVEWGIGYEGVFSDFKVFESYAWMHTVYGATQGGHTANGNFYDAVIPNSFEEESFPFQRDQGAYLLYIGRLIERKGLAVVSAVAERTGYSLVVAGSGDTSLIPKGAEYVGQVGPTARAELMGGAIATLVPTLYVEPFGGVAVESMLCGTPAITTDWGAFTETVPREYRARTLHQFVRAVDIADSRVSRLDVRDWSTKYLTKYVRYDYNAYFEQLDGLSGLGWYS